jgi:anti-sigma-K factor RskA
LKHDLITEEGQQTAALYALGALCQHEARSFENHLGDGCAICQNEVAEFERVAALIGTASASVEPPAYLRDQLIERISREARPSKEKTETRAEVIPFPDKSIQSRSTAARKSLVRNGLLWAIAATLLLAFAFSFFLWQKERQNLQAATERVEAFEAFTEKTRQELVEAKKAKLELDEINAAIHSPETRFIAMKGGEVAPSSSAKIFWDVQNKRWVVTGELPPAPAGKAYQLWFVTAEAKISAGVMKADPKGRVFAVVDVPARIAPSIKAAAFTLEPETGSPQPTSDIYAFGKV